MKASHHPMKTCAVRSSNRCCCGHLLASTSSLAFLFIPSLALCVRISLSLRFISIRHRSCSALSSMTLCITDDALATACSNAAGLLFVDSTDSTIQGGKRNTGKTTARSEFWGKNATIKELFSVATFAMLYTLCTCQKRRCGLCVERMRLLI